MKAKSTKKKVLMALSYVLVIALAIGATIAYLTSTDDDVNVMTLGNVKIKQLEYERTVDANGKWIKATEYNATFGNDTYTPDKLQEFTQNKPAYPAVYTDGTTKWDDRNGSQAASGPQSHQQSWNEVGAPGSNQLFDDSVKNVIDKFVFVKNTGDSNAYIRTWFAFEAGNFTADEMNNKKIHWNRNAGSNWSWTDFSEDMSATIEGTKYYFRVATYIRNDGVLTPNEVTRPSLLQFLLDPSVTNADVAAFDDEYDILVFSQAVQTAGFEGVGAQAALNEVFKEANANNHPWVNGIVRDTVVTAENFDEIDFSEAGQVFRFRGKFDNVDVNELGAGSILAFDEAEVKDLSVSDDATISGNATIDSIKLVRNSAEPIALTLSEADVSVTNAISVSNTDGKSVLNIENSDVKAASIFVGGHTMNAPAAKAEFNVSNSYLNCEENALGSTISVWGRSGVDAKIMDSEIHTYSRGWHQSEDANDNSITFQGSDHINVEIERSNMHLYGARSIVNARKYGNAECDVNFSVNESLIWVVTKSNHQDETLPIWGATDIRDSLLLFTKNVYQSSPAVVKSFVYGNPVVHGKYAVVTQCGWATDIEIANGQTVTIATGADVSTYEGAAEVNFVLNENAKVIVEAGATLTNIGVKAAEGCTLNTNTSNGVTTYSVTK